MSLFKRHRLFVPRPDGRFDVELSSESRESLVNLAEQLEEMLTSGEPETRRLFPTAYHDDPEKDAGYQILARDQLIEKRRDAIAVLKQTAEADSLSEEDLGAWMGVMNDLRLVLGTVLDVSEDDDKIDLNAPDAGLHLIYRQLGELVHRAVEALTTALPEPEED